VLRGEQCGNYGHDRCESSCSKIKLWIGVRGVREVGSNEVLVRRGFSRAGI
jgi:hypothetical protein